MSPVQVIGVGSPLGLDRIGWEVIDGLEGRGLAGRFPAGTVTLTVWDRPGSLLVQALRQSEAVIIIDAMRAGGPIGEVQRLTPGQLIGVEPAFVSSHDVGIPQALALARALGELPERTVIYGIEIGTVAQAVTAPSLDALCAAVLAGMETMVTGQLRQWVEERPAGPGKTPPGGHPHKDKPRDS